MKLVTDNILCTPDMSVKIIYSSNFGNYCILHHFILSKYPLINLVKWKWSARYNQIEHKVAWFLYRKQLQHPFHSESHMMAFFPFPISSFSFWKNLFKHTYLWQLKAWKSSVSWHNKNFHGCGLRYYTPYFCRSCARYLMNIPTFNHLILIQWCTSISWQ